MTLKYFRYLFITLLGAVVLSSCLSSEEYDHEKSSDAQIYSFSMSSRGDTIRHLSDIKFSIDQLNGKIFNRDSLPYLFDIDSVKLEMSGKTSGSFTDIEIGLINNDSVFTLGADSIPFKRLKTVKTTAVDGESMMKYDLEINIHQQDPYIISWALMAENQVNWTFDSQKTVCHDGQFITYFEKAGVVQAITSTSNDGAQWAPVVVSGLPGNIVLSSLIAVSGDNAALYIMTDDGAVWQSLDGQLWSKLDLDYSVRALYGIMPMIERSDQLLVLVEVDGEMQFATTTDFNEFKLWNKSPEDLPVKDFEAVKVENPLVYGAKYIVIYGGRDANNEKAEKLWILQENRGLITAAGHKPGIDIVSAALFYYDNKVYLLAFDGKVNTFYMSSNYGLNWQSGGENQALPEGFKVRKTTSVITDNDNFIWIFGGKSNTNNHILDVWRGRLNKLAAD